jgi:DNA-binding NarL/FixJ family response regulator
MSRGVTSAGVLVIDEPGTVFGILRSLNLGVSLWRATSSEGIPHAHVALTVVAAYERLDWDLIGELAAGTSTIIVTTHPTTDDACHAVVAGALGYVDAHLQPEALRRSVLGALQGEHAYSRRILPSLIRNSRWLSASEALPLTPRQKQVIQLIARGAADKEIAQSLGITTATAQKHVTNLLRRLNVPNRAAAVAVMSTVYHNW